MIRLAPLFLLTFLAGCERPAPAPRAPEKSANDGFDNAAASHSIMQPKVIAESPPEPTPTPTERPAPTGTTIGFASGTTLDATGQAALDALLADPALPAEARWILRGSSDTGGSDAANLAVSRRRAEAVRVYLVDKGVPAERITVIALGDGRPVAPNVTLDGADDPVGRARNRRVDVEIVAPAATQPLPAPTPSATSR